MWDRIYQRENSLTKVTNLMAIRQPAISLKSFTTSGPEELAVHIATVHLNGDWPTVLFETIRLSIHDANTDYSEYVGNVIRLEYDPSSDTLHI